jgi:hypothetical protein
MKLIETIKRILNETREEKVKEFMYSKFDRVFNELDLEVEYGDKNYVYGKWYDKDKQDMFHRNDWGVLWISKCGPYKQLRNYSKSIGLDLESFSIILLEYLNDKYKEQFLNKPIKQVGDEHYCLEDE